MRSKNFFIYLLFFFSALPFWELANPMLEQSAVERKRVIVLDPGHGGKDPGTTSRSKKVKEKNIVLAVSLALKKKIENNLTNVTVICTREKDVLIDLIDRAELANREKADLFISIHCNANRSRKPFGTETFIAGSHRLDEQDHAMRENMVILKEKNYKEKYGGYDPQNSQTQILMSLYKNTFREQSFKFANIVEEEFVKSGRKSRGAKEKGLIVLQRCARPGVLIELGFLSNYNEEKYLRSKSGQERIVNAIYKAIEKYFGKTK